MRLYVGENEIKGIGVYLDSPQIEDATVEANEVLQDKVFYNNDGKGTGTMPNNGAVNAEVAAGEAYTIPQGYHDGAGAVSAKTLEEQTPGTAVASDILSNKTAYVNGVQVTGSMTNNGAVSTTVNPGSSYTVPNGYHNGSGKVSGPALSTLGDATAADVAAGKTFTSAAGLNVEGTSTAKATDFDDIRMEEEQMLDLTGYTHYYHLLYGYNQSSSAAALGDIGATNKTIILINYSDTTLQITGSNSATGGTTVLCTIPPYEVIKMVFPYRYIKVNAGNSNAYNISWWVKK